MDEEVSTPTVHDTIVGVARRIVAIAAIVGAVYLLATGHVNESGWGWLVFLAFLAA